MRKAFTYDNVARFGIVSTSWTTVTLGWLAPKSLTFKLFAEGGASGQVLLHMMTLIVLLLILDIIGNDWLPTPRLHYLQHKRVFLFAALAHCYAVQALVAIGPTLDMGDILPISYLASALLCGWYVWSMVFAVLPDKTNE